MTPMQVAKKLGYTVGTIRHKIRKGEIKAKTLPRDGYRLGIPRYEYDVTEREVERQLSLPKVERRGRPKGGVNDE